MKINVKESKSPLGFATKGGGDWKVWDRFITIEGKDAYHIGNVCGTCAFFFQRLSGANKGISPREFQNELSSGLTGLTECHAVLLSELLPDGGYELSLQFRIPRLVEPRQANDYFSVEQAALWGIDRFSGLPHDPRTKYYRGQDRPLGGGAHFYEFFIPMFPESWLDIKQVSKFEHTMQNGGCPTALAISVLDIKQPANWDDNQDITSHWCLAHYIIDGHHKLFAAARAKRRVGLVSMLALDQGHSGPEEHVRLASELSKG